MAYQRAQNAERAKALLREAPMSRFAVECKLGIGQQRASEALRDIGAQIVGHEPRDCRGHPMPIYALAGTPVEAPLRAIRAVSSVWQLGAVQ